MLRRTLKSSLLSILVLLCSSSVSGQEMFGPGQMGQPRSGGFQEAVTGEVVRIDSRSLVIMDLPGRESEINLSLQTKVIREEIVELDQIRKGNFLVILGDDTTDGRISARIIEVRDGEPSFPRHDAGLRPPGGQSQGMAGPTTGEVVGLDPVTIRDDSGREKTVEISGQTRLTRMTTTDLSGIRKGARVRVSFTTGRGGNGQTAGEVIILSGMESPLAGKAAQPAITSDTLLPDLPQQEKDADFIIGLWLGRGLYTNEELDRAFRVARNLGVRYFMVEFKWAYVEPQNDRWRWNDQSHLDVEHVIELAGRYGISVIPYLDIFMPWGETRFVSPEKGECEGLPSVRQHQAPDPKEYAEYVFTVVDKLKKGGVDVRYVELDNEVSLMNDGYQSWNCHINVTARELKEAQNAAYDRLKAAYPDVKVSSTTFPFPGIGTAMMRESGKDKERRNSFIKVYFGEEPRPRFDFLGVHEVFSGSGNPYTMTEKPSGADYQYNFGSYHDAYEIWRKILDRYGHENKPIFNLESGAILRGRQDAQLIQRAVFARANAAGNRVRGWVVSQLTGSRAFTEGRGRGGINVGITSLGNGYELREGYFAFYLVSKMLRKYPIYEGQVQGRVNSGNPWVEMFADSRGNSLYIAFVPYGSHQMTKQSLTLNIGREGEVIVTGSDNTTLKVNSSGSRVSLSVDEHPLFVEVPAR